MERNPGVLDVVGVVMKYSTMDVLPCLKEIVEDVLLQMNSSFQKKNSYAFLKVFYTFTVCIKKLVNPKCVSIQERNIKTQCKSSQIIQSLLEHYESKKVENEEVENHSCEIKFEEEDKTRKEEAEEEEENIDQVYLTEQEGI